jgi:hypothetical protein
MTTTTLQKEALPVTEQAFKTHIVHSPEYQKAILDYGQLNMEMYVDTDPYEHAKALIEGLDVKNSLDCFDCFKFGMGVLWISEFGAKDYVGYSCILDMETGTGAMYRYASKNKVSCRCDTI